MKSKLFIITLFTWSTSCAQVISSSSVVFKIENSDICITPHAWAGVILSIKNGSEQKICVVKNLPSVPLISESKNRALYEVLFCTSKDTLNYTELVRVHLDDFYDRILDSISLLPNETYFWKPSPNISTSYFTKAGKYRIRFLLRRENFSPILSEDIYSNWITVTITHQ